MKNMVNAMDIKGCLFFYHYIFHYVFSTFLTTMITNRILTESKLLCFRGKDLWAAHYIMSI